MSVKPLNQKTLPQYHLPSGRYSREQHSDREIERPASSEFRPVARQGRSPCTHSLHRRRNARHPLCSAKEVSLTIRSWKIRIRQFRTIRQWNRRAKKLLRRRIPSRSALRKLSGAAIRTAQRNVHLDERNGTEFV